MNPEKRMIAYLQEAAEEAQTADGTQIGVAELLERFFVSTIYAWNVDQETFWWRKTSFVFVEIIDPTTECVAFR